MDIRLGDYPQSAGYYLLTPGNPKLAKGKSVGYWTFALHLAPHTLSGHNVCGGAVPSCIELCINVTGRAAIMAGHGLLTTADVVAGIQNSIQRARIRKTRLFFEQRALFLAMLVRDIECAIRRARTHGYIPVFRLNATSDIRWELYAVRTGDGRCHRNIMAAFPDIQFYDYTKLHNRRGIPANYHLTFSATGQNEDAVRHFLSTGGNVAIVYRNESVVMREVARGAVRGDDTDLRFLDPPGVIVALKAKGHAKRDVSGFVRD